MIGFAEKKSYHCQNFSQWTPEGGGWGAPPDQSRRHLARGDAVCTGLKGSDMTDFVAAAKKALCLKGLLSDICCLLPNERGYSNEVR